MSEKTDPLAKALKDVDFWRDNYQKLDAARKQLELDLTAAKKEIAELSRARSERAEAADEILADRNEAIRLMTLLAEHTAGRDGNLAKSKLFCGVCQHPTGCPIKQVYEYIGRPIKSEEAA